MPCSACGGGNSSRNVYQLNGHKTKKAPVQNVKYISVTPQQYAYYKYIESQRMKVLSRNRRTMRF